MSTIENPRFDAAELDRFLNHFEHVGPAAPEGAAEFCEAFASWIEEAEAEEDRAAYRADLLFIRGMLDTALGDYERAIELLHDSVDASRRSGNVRRHIFGLCSMATCYDYAGMRAEASGRVFEALRLAEELGDERLRAAVSHSVTGLYDAQGAHEQMFESSMRTVAIAEALDDRPMLLRAYNAAGIAHAYLNRPDEGLEWMNKAIALVDDETQPFVQTYLDLNLTYMYRRLGRLADAVELAEQHLDLIAELPAQSAAVFYVDIAEIYLEENSVERAAAMLELADRVSDPDWMKAHLLDYYRVAADVHEARNEPAEGLQMLRRYMQLEGDIRGRQAETRLVALERHFAAELAARTEEVHHLRTVELVEKNNQLSSLIEQNQEILEVVVNDLRNPLAATRLLTNLLLDKCSQQNDESAVELVVSIQSATVEMSRAIDRLLDAHDAASMPEVDPSNDVIDLDADEPSVESPID